jgi:peptidoglycan lytic transglycosylase F
LPGGPARSRLHHALAVIGAAILVGAYLAVCVAFILLVRPRPTPLEKILAAGEITVITRNNANCYYLYRGSPMGFEYDLARAFADRLGVRLKVRVAEKWQGMIPELRANPQAFIAANMTITPRRKRQVTFSRGYMAIQQHIIAHRRNTKIKDVVNLAGQQVHVRRGTSYQERLEALQALGLDMEIVLHDDLPTEELIRMVSQREIDLTIADSNIAMLNRRYFPRAVMAAPLTNEEELGWAVHPEAQDLARAINRFFRSIKKDGTYDRLHRKYYADVEVFDYLDLRAFHRRLESRLPRYRETIQAAAEENGLDWRLIAAQAYQESHLDPEAQSHAGAFGLMQLTLRTAQSLGVSDVFDPVQNIRAGVRYLKHLYDRFDEARSPDRMSIALAAYNIGQGHIHDAKQLAVKKGLDPNRWAALYQTLPLLRYRKYYKKAKYGYARGTEPITYVRQIAIYYDILRYQSMAEKRAAAIAAREKERPPQAVTNR